MDVKELITCILCMEIYDESQHCPKMLFCGHSFCSSCIEKFLKNLPNCPICKAYIHESNPNLIAVNYSLKDLSEKYWIENANGSLDKSNDLFLLIKGSSPKAEGFCKVHKIDRRFHCNTCLAWICGDCATINHKNCETVTIEDAITNMKGTKIKRIEKYTNMTSKYFDDVTSILIQYKENLTYDKNELQYHLEKVLQMRNKILKDNQDIQVVEDIKENLTLLDKDFKSIKKPANKALCSKDLDTVENNLIKYINTYNAVSRNIDHQKMHLFNEKKKQEERDSIIYKQWLLLDTLSTKKVLVGEDGNEGTRWGEVSSVKKQIWIHYMETCQVHSSSVSLKLEHFLNALLGRHQLPKKVFLELATYGVLFDKIIINLHEIPEASKAFLHACLGCKGTSTFKGSELYYSDGGLYIYTISSLQISLDVDSNKLLKERRVHKKKFWNRGEVAFNICHGSQGLEFYIYFMVKNATLENEWIPLGELSNGVSRICENVSQRRRVGADVEIWDCGWVLG